MEEEKLIPGGRAILWCVEACASGIDSLCQWMGNNLPSFLVEDVRGLTVLAAFGISLVLWAVLHKKLYSRITELYFKLSLPWWDAIFLVGMAAGYPFYMKTQRGLGFFGWLYFDSTENPVTWFNYREWDGFFQFWLALAILGTVLLGLLFLFSIGPEGLFGTIAGMSMFFFAGYGLMRLYGWIYQVVCINVLDENLIAALLNIALGFPQVIPLIMLPISFLALFMTRKLMSDLAKARVVREKRQRTKKNPVPDYDYELPVSSIPRKTGFPSSLRAPSGETYRLNYENGERAEYLCSRTGDRVDFHITDFEDGSPTGWNAY